VSTVELLIGVLTVTMPLVALARRVLVPYPVVLVLGGLALSFIPGLPSVELDPNLVFVIFLPPLLYWTTVTAPTDDIRVNAAWVWGMGVGLVLATAFAIAAVARYVVVGMSGPIRDCARRGDLRDILVVNSAAPLRVGQPGRRGTRRRVGPNRRRVVAPFRRQPGPADH